MAMMALMACACLFQANPFISSRVPYLGYSCTVANTQKEQKRGRDGFEEHHLDTILKLYLDKKESIFACPPITALVC